MWLYRDGKTSEFKGTFEEYLKSSLPSKGWIPCDLDEYRPEIHNLGPVKIIGGRALYEIFPKTDDQQFEYRKTELHAKEHEINIFNLNKLLSSEMLIYHGLKTQNNGLALRFSILHFFNSVKVKLCYRIKDSEEPLPKMVDGWFDKKFEHASSVFQQTFNKISNASFLLESTIGKINTDRKVSRICDISTNPEYVHLYIDLLLIYIRIQADCLANMIPNLYGLAGKKQSIPRDSMRDQINWFTRKKPDFDPIYSNILSQHSNWFNLLSGSQKGQGLRDIVMHYRGVYDLQYPHTGEEPFYFKAKMCNESGVICEDIFSDLKTVVDGYFRFLDKTFIYFLAKFRDEIDTNIFSHLDVGRPFIHYQGNHHGLWIFPEIRGKNSSEILETGTP